MRQQLKLTRDVSLPLYNRWQPPVFLNAANAQQFQIDAMKALTDKYGITDPVADNTQSAFTDPAFSQFYQTMVTRGMTSMENALRWPPTWKI